jgi:hypothetical protein
VTSRHESHPGQLDQVLRNAANVAGYERVWRMAPGENLQPSTFEAEASPTAVVAAVVAVADHYRALLDVERKRRERAEGVVAWHVAGARAVIEAAASEPQPSLFDVEAVK